MWFPTHFKASIPFSSLCTIQLPILIMEKKKHDDEEEPTSLFTNSLIQTIHFSTKTLASLSSLTSDPLFSIFITLYTLILLYFPGILLNLLFSPILISTAILLSTLLRLGSNQTLEKDELLASTAEVLEWVSSEPEPETDYDPKPSFSESMVEWNRNVGAPLEVIYEEYEEGEDEPRLNQKQQNRDLGIAEFSSFSIYYPESDSDSSSDGDFPAIQGWDSPENMCFRWDEEDDREGLIEIPLNGKGGCCDFQVEEDNLIEIDLSQTGAPTSM